MANDPSTVDCRPPSIHVDRREIAPLLLPHFPEMEGAGSDEWHAFLDQVTGLATRLDEQNATAFDRWRQALAAMDIPVWSITPAAAAAMRARGEELAQRVKRRANQIERLKSFETRPRPSPGQALAGAPQDEGSA
jgi:hypothetical protein